MCVHLLCKLFLHFERFFSCFQFFCFHFSFLMYISEEFCACFVFCWIHFASRLFCSRIFFLFDALFCCIFFMCVNIILKCIIWTAYMHYPVLLQTLQRASSLSFSLKISHALSSHHQSVCVYIHTSICIYFILSCFFFVDWAKLRLTYAHLIRKFLNKCTALDFNYRWFASDTS